MSRSSHDRFRLLSLMLVLSGLCGLVLAADYRADPPKDWTFPLAKMETLTPAAADVLTAPEGVSGDFTVAKTPPAVDFGLLPGQWKDAKLWSNWGDSIFASDGNFYCSIGEHQGPHGYSYVYQVNPKTRQMQMVVDFAKVLNLPANDYTPGKIHCSLMEMDGWLYFVGYRGSGGTDNEHNYKGDPMLRYELATGKIEQLPIPAPYCSVPSTVIYQPGKMLYGLGTPGKDAPTKGDAFFAYDLANQKLVYMGGPDPDVCRSILVAPDGRAYYSTGSSEAVKSRKGEADKAAVVGVLAMYDPKTRKAEATKLQIPGDGQLRAASRPDANGIAYGISKDGVVFSFDCKTEKMQEITKTFVAGPPYTAVCKLSGDERFLYYVPSAHGGSNAHGTAVIQLDLKTGKRKVLAFLNAYLVKQKNYNTGGTFGIDISKDGSMLMICFNGKQLDNQVSRDGAKSDFDQCAAAIVHIPQSER